ncbi:MAG: N-6 DNA methylase [Pirellulales bacterium]
MLGALRQTLLEYELIAPQLAAPPSAADQTPAAWQATRSLARRRGTGSYYTPFPLRRWLVQRTLAPAWRAWLRATATSDSDSPPPRVLDPAMGAGHFLVSAHQWLARQLRKLASEAPHHPAVATANGRYERFVLAHCLWGTDSDAVTVAAARVGLWLAAGAPSQTTGFERLQLADALVEPVIEPSGFDVVLGNPPYGKPADRAYRSVVRKRFAGTRHNADLSVAFVALAREALRPAGRVGLVLPKPLSYSAAWRRLRREITPEVVALCDVECGWREVRLEQMLLVLSPHARRAGYATARADGTRFVRGPRCAVSLATRLDTLPAGADVRDWRRFDRLRCGRQSFGDVCRTFRGLPAQRQLRAAGEIAVLGGRDLVPFGVRSTSGYLAAAEVPAELTNGPRLLFQNIVAHVQRPRPHLRLIGTWHAGQLATLDTVNNVVDRRDEVDLWAVLALLQSQLVNWYVYTFVYNRAVRTMHFDQYFLDKIPLPERLDDYAAALAAAARRATEITAARPAAVGYDRTLSSAIPARGTSGRSDTADALQIELRLVNHDIESLTRAAYGLR